MTPARIRKHLAAAMERIAGWATPSCRGGWWVATAVAIGTLPLGVSWYSGVPGHQAASAVLLALVCLGCARHDTGLKGLGVIGTTFASHSAAAIWLSMLDAARAAVLLPGAAAYWDKQLAWITTGIDPEYQLAAWVPAHIQLLAAMVLFCVVSLGALTFYQGFIEVDLMNYYNAQLLRESATLESLFLGWHPWSVLRGVGYAFLSFELISLAMGTVGGRSLSSPARRRLRWSLGLAFLVGDGIVKYALMESVRAELYRLLAGA